MTIMEDTIETLRARRSAEAVRTAVDAALATLEAVPADADAIRVQLARDLDATRQLDVAKLGTDRRDREIELVTSTAAEAAARLRTAAEGAAATVLGWRQEQPDTAGDSSAQLLAEMQEQRAWARMRAQLDAGTPARTLIEQARQAGDYRSLIALRAEFAAWAVASDAAVNVPAALAMAGDALLETAPKEQRALLLVDRGLAGGTAAAERALASLEAAVASYGSFQDGPAPLNKALRTLDVQAANPQPAA